MFKGIFLELLRWSLRFHGIFHIGHVYSDFVVGNWVGVGIGLGWVIGNSEEQKKNK